jgi:hypothetical protein
MEDGFEDLDWTWERAINSLRALHASPERWGWRYVMHSLGFAAEQNEKLTAKKIQDAAAAWRRRRLEVLE